MPAKNVKLFSCLDEFAVAKKHMGGFSDHTSVSSPPFSTGKSEVFELMFLDNLDSRKRKHQKVN